MNRENFTSRSSYPPSVCFFFHFVVVDNRKTFPCQRTKNQNERGFIHSTRVLVTIKVASSSSLDIVTRRTKGSILVVLFQIKRVFNHYICFFFPLHSHFPVESRDHCELNESAKDHVFPSSFFFFLSLQIHPTYLSHGPCFFFPYRVSQQGRSSGRTSTPHNFVIRTFVFRFTVFEIINKKQTSLSRTNRPPRIIIRTGPFSPG